MRRERQGIDNRLNRWKYIDPHIATVARSARRQAEQDPGLASAPACQSCGGRHVTDEVWTRRRESVLVGRWQRR